MYRHFLSDLEQDKSLRDRRYGTYFDSLENEILEEEKRIIELVDSHAKIKEHLQILAEKKQVFDKSFMLINADPEFSQNFDIQPSGMIEEGVDLGLKFIAGVINADEDLKMKRMIFRASKGRAMSHFFDFANVDFASYPQGTDKVVKKIFIIFFQGGVENILLNKLLKICDVLGASRYNLPRRDDVNNQVRALQAEIDEKKTFLKEAELSIKNYLRDKLGTEKQPGKIHLYKLYFRKEKLIFSNLNKCIISESFIDAEVWILKKNCEKVKSQVKNLFRDDDSRPVTNFISLEEANIPRPTYIPTNDFLWSFQEIVNTYGVPRYQEINPTYFNIITFPFLFGIMFGDIGHGGLLTIFGLYLCFNSSLIKQESKSMLKPAIKGRYLILLMGIFAFYCGWMYNDFLSIPLPIFGSCYENKLDSNSNAFATKKSSDCVYPIGLDPKWYVSKNELAFFNSVKMKISVIFGVSHMLFGIVLRGLNDIHFGNKIGFIFEFLPQLVFMSTLFGYMVIMIFIKWSINWYPVLANAPSLIAQMMNIFLKGGSVVLN